MRTTLAQPAGSTQHGSLVIRLTMPIAWTDDAGASEACCAACLSRSSVGTTSMALELNSSMPHAEPSAMSMAVATGHGAAATPRHCVAAHQAGMHSVEVMKSARLPWLTLLQRQDERVRAVHVLRAKQPQKTARREFGSGCACAAHEAAARRQCNRCMLQGVATVKIEQRNTPMLIPHLLQEGGPQVMAPKRARHAIAPAEQQR